MLIPYVFTTYFHYSPQLYGYARRIAGVMCHQDCRAIRKTKKESFMLKPFYLIRQYFAYRCQNRHFSTSYMCFLQSNYVLLLLSQFGKAVSLTGAGQLKVQPDTKCKQYRTDVSYRPDSGKGKYLIVILHIKQDLQLSNTQLQLTISKSTILWYIVLYVACNISDRKQHGALQSY
jgi:hypothetical protein